MPSTYTQNLGVEKPATGEQAGGWGNTANNNYDFIDAATDGDLHIQLSASTYNLATSNGAVSEGRNKVIIWTGTLTSSCTVNVTPNNAQKLYFMSNATSGGFPIVFQQGTGGAFSLDAGQSAIIYCDGAGAGARCDGANYNPQFGNISVKGSFTTAGPSNFNQPVTFGNAVNLNGATTITVPSVPNAAGDIYYRAGSGVLTPLPIGTPGQLLQVAAGPTIVWSTPPALALGIGIGGSIANGLLMTNASGQMTQGPNLLAVVGTGIGLGVLPTHTLELGHGLVPEIWLDASGAGTAGQQRQLVFSTAGSPRWLFYSPIAAESAGNVSSNLALVPYDDGGGNSLPVCMWFTRQTSNVTIGSAGDPGARLGIYGTNAGQPVLSVHGAASQSAVIQEWRNSAGGLLASLDNTGKLFLNNTSPFVVYTAPNNRVSINGTVGPYGDIHIGTNGGGGMHGSLVFEMTSTPGSGEPMGDGRCRMYYRNSNFVIQFSVGGVQYYLYTQLIGTVATATWNLTNLSQL